jgi:hypothetical protein
MVFALERTAHALHLLSVEKTAAGFSISHHESSPLAHKARLGIAHHDMHWIQTLQHMRRALPHGTCPVYMGINDRDLMLRCIPAFSCTNKTALYQHCQKALSAALSYPIHHYSWDVQTLNTYHGQGYYAFCAAYPLAKIIFLQEISAVCEITLQVIEPSALALARFIHHFLHIAYALFLLQEEDLYTLCLALNGDIFAVVQFSDLTTITTHYLSWLSDPLCSTFMKDITTIWIYPGSVNMPTDFPLAVQYIENTAPIGIGLAIREYLS